MAQSYKKPNDANEAALNAIEEALNLAATEVYPQHAQAEPMPVARPKKITQEVEALPLTAEKIESVVKQDEPFLAPSSKPANDEQSSMGQMLYAMNQPVSKMPLYAALGLAVFWFLFAGLGFFNSSLNIFAILALTFTPALVIAACGFLYIRTQEMRLMTRGLSEVAYKLAAPETASAEGIARVSDAIKREVDTMNASIALAMSKVGSLEGLVQKEIGTIEGTFNTNEERLRSLIEALGTNHQAFAGQTAEHQEKFTLLQQSFLEDLNSKTGALNSSVLQAGLKLVEGLALHSNNIVERLDDIHAQSLDKLTSVGTKVGEDIGLRINEVNTIFKHTGDSLILDLGLRGNEVTQKLDETGSRIAEYITEKGHSLADKIAETGDRLYETVNVHGVELDKRIAETGKQIISNLALRTTETEKSMNDVGTHLVDTLSMRAEDVQMSLRDASEKVSVGLFERASNFKNDIESVGSNIVDAMSERSQSLSTRMELLTANFNSNMKDNTQELNTHLVKNFEAIDNVVTKNGGALLQGFTGKLSDVAETLDTRLSRVTEALDERAEKLNKTLAERTIDLATTLTTGGEQVSSLLISKTSEMSGALEAKIENINSSLNNLSEKLNKTLSERTIDLATTLTTGGEQVSSLLISKTSEMSGELKTHIETINSSLTGLSDRLDERGEAITQALTQRVEKVTDVLTSRASEVAKSITEHSANLTTLFDEKGGVFLTSLAGHGEKISHDITRLNEEVLNKLNDRSSAITQAIALKSEEATDALTTSSVAMVQSLSQASAAAVVALNETNAKVSNELSGAIHTLHTTNSDLKNLAQDAQSNLGLLGTELNQQMSELKDTVDKVTSTSAASVNELDKQVDKMQEVSQGTLGAIAALASKIESHSEDMAKNSITFEEKNKDFSTQIEARTEHLNSLIRHLNDRSENLDALLKGVEERSKEIFNTAAENGRTVAALLLKTGQEQNVMLAQQTEDVRAKSFEERQATQAQMQAAYDLTQYSIQALYEDSAHKFNELTVSIRSMSSEISQELESTRTELKRGLIDLPKETQDHAAAMRRVVADQIKALAELNEIVAKSGRSFDVVEPKLSASSGTMMDERKNAPETPPFSAARVAPEPFVAAEPVLRREVPKQRIVSAPIPIKPVEKQPAKEGWLSDLLARASKDEEREQEPRLRQTSSGLESLSSDIPRLVDSRAVNDLWERYRRGERNVFTMKLYTPQGIKTFEEITRRYTRDEDFRYSVDRYIDEFERVLGDINRETRDPNATRNALISDTGKAYTLLAHAAGRFE